jgi:outer membrane biosynthesis protein TonB
MTRFQPALKACAGLIAATVLATACGATTTENQAASETTVTTTVTATPATKAAKPAPLVSIPAKKPTATAVPTVKPPKKLTVPKPTRKPTAHRTTTKPKPKPRPTATKTTASTYYANCSEVRAAGAAPIHRGEPGYSSKLDRDGDGIACE